MLGEQSYGGKIRKEADQVVDSQSAQRRRGFRLLLKLMELEEAVTVWSKSWKKIEAFREQWFKPNL